MEYLVLAGGELRESLSQSLGQYGPLFWTVIAPIGLVVVWAGCIYVLWETWFGGSGGGEGRGSGVLKLLFSALLVVLILGSGTGLEFLLLGEGHIHFRLLRALVGMARIR